MVSLSLSSSSSDEGELDCPSEEVEDPSSAFTVSGRLGSLSFLPAAVVAATVDVAVAVASDGQLL